MNNTIHQWSPRRVSRVLSNNLELDLELDFDKLISDPMRILQAVLDHHHGHYAQELELAALGLARRKEREAHRARDN